MEGESEALPTYETFRKPARQGTKGKVVPHGTYPSDPLHYGHQHAQQQEQPNPSSTKDAKAT